MKRLLKPKKVISLPEKYPENLDKKSGVFVTIYKKILNTKELRGCIGLPYPVKPLIEAVIDAAAAACRDQRFLPIKPEELSGLIIEVSVLTEPELISVKNPKDYLKKIKLGEDGLIIKKGIMSGLLLPQVPVEQGWNIENYLENLCFKAGLLPHAIWTDPAVELFKFRAQIFSEKL